MGPWADYNFIYEVKLQFLFIIVNTHRHDSFRPENEAACEQVHDRYRRAFWRRHQDESRHSLSGAMLIITILSYRVASFYRRLGIMPCIAQVVHFLRVVGSQIEA